MGLLRSLWPHYSSLAAWILWVLPTPSHIRTTSLLIFPVQQAEDTEPPMHLSPPGSPGVVSGVPLQTLSEPTPTWGTASSSSAEL